MFSILGLLSSCGLSVYEKEAQRISDSTMRANIIQRYKDDSIQKVMKSKVFWKIKYYYDDFGDQTKDGFLSNTNIIQGTFSNSATENSELKVVFLINDETNINIQLYEYAGTNPVKHCTENGYRIKVKSDSSEIVTLEANNYSDRLSLSGPNSKKLSKVLSHPGKIHFSIIEMSEYSSSSYKFEFENSDNYQRVLSELKTLKSK